MPRIALKNFAAAISLANLCFFKQWSTLTLPEDQKWTVYKAASTFPSTYLALLLNIFFLGTIICGLMYLSKAQLKRIRYPAIAILFFTTILAANGMRLSITDENLSLSFIHTNLFKAFSALAILIIGYLFFVYRAGLLRWVRKGAYHSLLLLFPLFILNIYHAIYLNHKALPTPKAQPLRIQNGSLPKVVIFLFDEWDFRISFVDRQKDMLLPNLDKLRNQSIFTTNTHAPSSCTPVSLPSMITGNPIHSVEVKNRNELLLHSKGKRVHPWSESKNIFSLTRDMGGKSALHGWYHPYCRILGADLDKCSAFAHPMLAQYGYTENLFPNMIQLFREILTVRVNGGSPFHLSNFNSIYEETKHSLLNDQIKLIFSHWPIPHSPWIFDTQTKTTSSKIHQHPWKGYFGNLKLVDKTVGELIQLSSDANKESSTYFILTSDHHWRDTRYFSDKKDFRIPFIVKKLSDSSPIEVTKPLNAMVLYKLVDSLMNRRINSHREIADWLEKQDIPQVDYRSCSMT